MYLCLTHADLILSNHLLELGKVKTDDIIEDTVHWLLKIIQASLWAILRQSDELDDTLQIELLTDPKELVDA